MTKKAIGVALDVELHTKVKIAAAQRGTNLEGAYEQAIKAWLGDDTPEFRGKYAECHRLLEIILRHAQRDAGYREAASGMKSLLKALGEQLLSEKKSV